MVLNQLQQEVLKGQFHGKSPDEQIRIAEMAVKMWTTETFTEEEGRIARMIGKLASGPFYHGGISGFETGFELLSSGVRGVSSRDYERSICGKLSASFNASNRRQYVFVTNRIEEAEEYASRCNGSVYEVEPQGDLLADLEYIRPILVCNAIPGSIWHQQAKLVREEDFVSGLARSMTAFCCPSAVVIG